MQTDSGSPTTHPPDEHRRAYERRRWVLVVLGASVFLVVVDHLIVNVALPTLQRDLDASDVSLQWIVDAYALVFACLLLAGRGLGDRWGRKCALQIGLALFAASCSRPSSATGPAAHSRCSK